LAGEGEWLPDVSQLVRQDENLIIEGVCMKTGLRFNLQHAGELFISAVQKAADSAIVISRKAVRTYDVNSLNSKKRKISGEIIERVSVLIKKGTSGVGSDAVLSRLVGRLGGIEKELAGYKKRNNGRVSPVTLIITRLGRALFSVK